MRIATITLVLGLFVLPLAAAAAGEAPNGEDYARMEALAKGALAFTLAFAVLGGILWVVVLRRTVETRTRELEASRNLFLDLVEGSVQGIAIHRGLDLVAFNDACARMLGFEDRTALDSLAQAVAPHELARLEQALEGGPTVHEFEGRRADGTPMWLLVATRKVMWEGAEASQTTLLDVTDRKHLEETRAAQTAELERSNDELQQFAYALSHDLQEPIRMVVAYLGLLDKRCRDSLGEEGREFLGHALDGGRRAQAMIHDMLEYARVHSRGAEPEPVPAAEAAEAALGNLAATIEETGARVTHNGLPTVLADRGQVVRVFQNLVGNALRYRRAGVAPEITLTAERDGFKWLFAVRDNGIGIEAEYSEQIFGLFKRLHGPATCDGTGIGLALCKRIVERHDGRIWVVSTPGEGSTFFFTLPMAGDLTGGGGGAVGGAGERGGNAL